MKKFTKDHVFGKIFATLIAIFLMTGFLAGQESVKKFEIYGKEAGDRVPGAEMIMLDPSSGFPTHVRLKDDHQISGAAFIPFIRDVFEFGGEYDFDLVKSGENTSGIALKAYRLKYNGVPIENALITAHLRNGSVHWFNGFADHITSMSVAPVISEQDALHKALGSIGAEKYMWEIPQEEAYLKKHMDDPDATYLPTGELVLAKAQEPASGYILAWRFDVREAAHRLDRTVFIDAGTGEVVKWYTLVYDCDAGSVPTTWHGTHTISTDYISADDNYILLDDCFDASIHTIMEPGNAEITDADNDWSEADRTDFATTHFYGRVTMDYYATVHGRASYNDANGDLTLRHVPNWANGQSIGSGIIRIGMNTGNQGGFYNTLDVVAHEFTHAVTAENGLGGLVYQGESGALNESFSDILGETAEMWFENGAYTVDWLHREDYVNGENRSLINPNDKNQPDTYEGDFWASTAPGAPDAGGVHTNSGVMNYWFYLLTAGGSGSNDNDDDYSVTGLGQLTTRELVYRLLTEGMTPNATFDDARTSSILLAIDMFGDCTHEVKQVTNAWYAVGVGNAYCEALLESPLNAGGYNISCNGYADGSIDLTPMGTAPFSYIWDDGPTTEDRTDLASGTYGVTMTDATGCTDYASITLTEPTVLSISASVTSDYNGYAVSCFGGSDGEATAAASGGVPPYTYQWDADAGNQVTAVATALPAGTYTVSVTDVNGCMADAQVTLDEPDPLTIDAGENQTVYFGYPPAACASLAYSSAGGGVPPYTFEWSTSETTQEIEVCPEETTEYTITITDANNCMLTDNVLVCVIDVRCGNKLDKVEICHYPPDNPANFQTLCVSVNAVPDHLSHGDMLAACGIDHNCPALERDLVQQAYASEEIEMELSAYPNPFSYNTKITFSTETDGMASLKLVNAYGQVIAVLLSENVKSNYDYQVEFDGNILLPGMYYCLLQQSNGSTKVIKLISCK